MRPGFHLVTTLLRTVALAGIGAATASAQVFVLDAVNLPAQPGVRYTESVDFGDVDLDGDFDAGLGLGGDFGNLQNRLWINQGGAQAGTLGAFADETAVRFPAAADTSRDLEFADIDSDADPDVFVSNTSSKANQGNRIWVNASVASGSFVDESASRWVGIGGAGSSIPPGSVLPDGTFIDWSGDTDFGDLDNDGDLDFVQSSYSGSMSGTVPTRIFLNDGDGYFSEFNPSGIQLAGVTIPDGTRGLWCEGDQQHDTTDPTGTFCDIATVALDVDLGDLDGDFDLDVLLGDLTYAPRVYGNLLEENGGALGFRDVTGAAFPAGYTAGTGHYEQELGDLDDDGDLDIFGLGWLAGGFGFDDTTLRNDGAGVFGNQSTVPGSFQDSNESDFIDYDNDGDLDVYVARFSGADAVYANLGLTGGGEVDLDPLTDAQTGLDQHGFVGNLISADADVCDWDGDGDYDVMIGHDVNRPVIAWLNQGAGGPDVTPPSLPTVEAVADRDTGTSCAPGIPVRTYVYDNAPYYITQFNATELVLEVDGIPLGTLPARSSGGQVFRAELPPNLVGQVAYAFRSSDTQGNQGTSATESYLSTHPGPPHAIPYGTGADGSLGPVAFDAESVLTPCLPLYFSIANTPPGTLYFMVIGTLPAPPTPIPGLGVWNVSGAGLVGVATRFGLTDAAGTAYERYQTNATIGTGFSIYAQAFTLDGVGADPWASSRGLEVPSLP